MRLRPLLVFGFILLTYCLPAAASRRGDLPTSGGGDLNDCGSAGFQLLFLSHGPLVNGHPQYLSPTLELTPVNVKDSNGNLLYTVHVDAFDWGTLVGCPNSSPSSPPVSELRTSGTHTILFVYVVGPDGETVSPGTLKSFEIAVPFTNPDFLVCVNGGDSGWQLCNTAVDGPGSGDVDVLQPAPSPGSDGTNTVWSFGTAYDTGNPSNSTVPGPIGLNSNSADFNSFTVLINGQTYPYSVSQGTAVLVADGTVTCDNPVDGPCNSISASTPYRLTFLPPGSSTPVTVSSLATTPTPVSAAGHDSASNPIVLTGGSVSAVYDASGNYPSQTNGLPVNKDGSSASSVTFTCSSASSSPLQQYRSVYFQYTAPATTEVYLSTAKSHYDTVLSVSGGSVQTCNDDDDPATSKEPNGIGIVTSTLSFQAVAGTTYQILVTEYPPVPIQLGFPVYPSSVPDTYVGPLSGDSTLYLTLSTPQLIATPATLSNFGSVAVGVASAAQTVTLKSSTANFGSTGITNVDATASGDFHVTPANCATPLPDSSSCTLSVTFAPTASGVRTGTLTVTSGGSTPAENTPLTFALSGTGTGSTGPASVTTIGGTNGNVPVFTGASTVVNSIIYQYNGGIGIGRAPAATLDVNGKSIFRGGQVLSRSGDATTSAGTISFPFIMQSSVYNSSIKGNLLPYFQLQTEPVGNNTTTTGATLNMLYYSGVGSTPSETGLYFNANGTIHFAAGQTFPAGVGVTRPADVLALRGPAGAAGPAGPVGPSGAEGPDIAVSGTIGASRGFFLSQFVGGNSAANAAVMSLDASTGRKSYGLLAHGAYAGVYAQGAAHAGQFQGDLSTDGSLATSGEAFRIDHPLDPANKYLSYSSVESPEMMDIYDGIVVTDASGTAVVTMPSYFEALNRDFRYQLTVMGQFSKAVVASEISGGAFTIMTDKPNVKVSWQVTGVRQDAWANAHRTTVEQDKAEKDKGSLLHPELYGHAEGADGLEHKLP